MQEVQSPPIDNCVGPALTVDCIAERLAGTPEPPRIFRGIIKPSLGCFFGPSKSGKTTLVENLAFSIAAGIDSFLSDPLVCQNPRVLLVSMEEYYRSRTERNKRQMEAFTQKYGLPTAWRENVFVVDETFPRYLITEEHWAILESEIERIRPSLVMLDSLTRATVDSIEDSSVATKLMKRLREIAHKHDIALVLIHHSQKLDDKPLTLASLAGSRVVGQELDFMIGINRTSAGIRYLKDVAYRYAPDDTEFVQKFSIDFNQIIIQEEQVHESDLLINAGGNREAIPSDQILMACFHELTGGDCSVLVQTTELYAKLVNTGKLSRPTLHAALHRLEAARILLKPQKGTYHLVPVS